MFQKQISGKLNFMYGLSILVISMICAVPFVMLESFVLYLMNDHALKAQGMEALILPGWFCALFVVVLLVLIGEMISQCYSESWRELQQTTNADLKAGINRAKNAPGTSSPGGETVLDSINPTLRRLSWGTGKLNKTRKNIRQVAYHFGVRLPEGDRYVGIGFGIPVLICTALFVCQIIPAQMAYSTIKTDSIAAVETLKELTEPDNCIYFNRTVDQNSQPLDQMEFYASGNYDSQFGCSKMRVRINEQGRVYEVEYHVDMNPELSPEENLRHVKQEFSRMQEIFLQVELPREAGNFQELPELSEEFCREFLKGDYGTEIYFSEPDRKNDRRIYMFVTEQESGGSDFYISGRVRGI